MRAGTVATHDWSLPAGWHHLAGVRRGARVTLFVDGVAVATGEGDDPPGAMGPRPAMPLTIGGGPRADFEGELAEVRVWDRAIEPGEIRALAG